MKKLCNKCMVEKDFSDFSTVKPGRGDRNNLASRCKKCRAARNLELHHKNRDAASKRRRNYYSRNIERERYQALQWRLSNPEKHSENYKIWSQKNRARLTFKQSMRSKRLQNATPPWLSDEHRLQMAQFYERAKELSLETGEKHHVDHIIPIKGANFSGLNVPWNMRVISASENFSKKNKVLPEHSSLLWGSA